MRSFWPREHGGVAIVTAIAVALFVSAFAGLMEIVSSAFESDRMNRAAWAAARATALDPNADACAVIRREIALWIADDPDCAGWSITVHRGVLPSNLGDTLETGANPGATGDMVLVEIAWERAVWSFANLVPDANAGEEGSDEPPARALVSRRALGLARSEPLG